MRLKDLLWYLKMRPISTIPCTHSILLYNIVNLNLSQFVQFLSSTSHYSSQPMCLLFSTLPDVWPSNPISLITHPHHFRCLFSPLSVLLGVLLSCTVIITSRSSNGFDSVSIADPQLAMLHAAANCYLINLSSQVQLGKSDKVGNL